MTKENRIVAQNEGQAIMQKKFKLSVFYFCVQKVHASGVHLDHHVIVPQLWVWHVAKPQAYFAFIAINEECLHDTSLLNSQESEGTSDAPT
jgi:hypothetical protein